MKSRFDKLTEEIKKSKVEIVQEIVKEIQNDRVKDTKITDQAKTIDDQQIEQIDIKLRIDQLQRENEKL